MFFKQIKFKLKQKKLQKKYDEQQEKYNQLLAQYEANTEKLESLKQLIISKIQDNNKKES